MEWMYVCMYVYIRPACCTAVYMHMNKIHNTYTLNTNTLGLENNLIIFLFCLFLQLS